MSLTLISVTIADCHFNPEVANSFQKTRDSLRTWQHSCHHVPKDMFHMVTDVNLQHIFGLVKVSCLLIETLLSDVNWQL